MNQLVGWLGPSEGIFMGESSCEPMSWHYKKQLSNMWIPLKVKKLYCIYTKPFFNSKFKIMIAQNDNSCPPIAKQSSPNNLLPL